MNQYYYFHSTYPRLKLHQYRDLNLCLRKLDIPDWGNWKLKGIYFQFPIIRGFSVYEIYRSRRYHIYAVSVLILILT